MTDDVLTTPSQWAERTGLLRKTMTYVFSVELKFVGDSGPGALLYAEAVDADSSTFHVLGSPTLQTAYGTHEEVPACRVRHGWAKIADDGTSDARRIDGMVTFALENGEMWRASISGVLNSMADRSNRVIVGSAFWSSQQETAYPRLGWLARHQMLWVSRFKYRNDVGVKGRVLEVTADLYTPG